MNELLWLVLLAISTTPILAQYWRSPNWQSFSSAQQDCAVYQRLSNETLERYARYGYPDELSSRKLINCILVNLQCWNETTGIKDYIISYFFRPASWDQNYRQRTQQCLERTVPAPGEGEKFERAYRSFKCYYQSYGDLIADEKQFIPFEHFELVKHRIESYGIVNTSCFALREFSKGNILTVEEFKDALFTKLVRTGFYSPVEAVHLDRAYKQFGVSEIIADSTQACVTARQALCLEEPEKLFQIFACVKDYVPTVQFFQEAAQDVIAGANSTCNRCEPEPGCQTEPSLVTVEPTPGPTDTTLPTATLRTCIVPCYNGQCSR